MKVIYKGIAIDSKIEEKRIEQLMQDDAINRVTKITVKIPTDNYSLTLVPSVDHITDEGLVSWGDNTGGYLNDTAVHVYEKAGVYDISGHFTFGLGVEPTDSMKECLVEVKNLTEVSSSLECSFKKCPNLKKFSCVTNVNVTNARQIFYGCYNIIEINNLNKLNMHQAISMHGVFDGCRRIKELDISSWNTSNVTSMWAMFADCYELENIIGLELINTINVTNMTQMFKNCYKLTSVDLSNFNTIEVTSMYAMFFNCNNLTSLDVSNFNTSNVTNMYDMFNGCSNLTSLDVSNFDTNKVTDIGGVFHNCTNLTIIGLIYANIDTLNKLPTPSIATIYIDPNIDQTAYAGSSKLEVYEQRTVTINIPIALRSNEEIADRIYWNDTDKHYYIEQNINPNTNETLETPNIIASGVKQPIYLKTYENMLSVGISNIDASYMSINVPFFEIPTDYEYKWEDELDYIKQSFELRFPDEEDVPNGWGFMGIEGEEGTGLKALIDWVDNCKDEEFVRDFDQHFNRDYTLRYFLLVITLGMVDNLG